MFNVIHWVGYKMLSMTSPSLMVMNPMKSDLGLACLYHWWNSCTFSRACEKCKWLVPMYIHSHCSHRLKFLIKDDRIFNQEFPPLHIFHHWFQLASMV